MRLSGQFQTGFFFTKIFIYKNTIKRTEKNKDNNFWRIKTSKKGKNICDLMLFVRCKPFRKKKPAWNCPDNLIDYTTEAKTY